jgi:outer membrane protein
MFRFKKISLIIVIFFLFSSNVISNDNFFFVDKDFIYSNSKLGKELENKIKIKTSELNDDIKLYQDELIYRKDQLTKKKIVISVKEYDNEINSIELDIKKINEKIAKQSFDLKTYENDSKIIFLNELKKNMAYYAEKNNISLIFDKSAIVMGKKELDLSKNIMNIMDDNYNKNQ